MKAFCLAIFGPMLLTSVIAQAGNQSFSYKVCESQVDHFVRQTQRLTSEDVVALNGCEELNDAGQTICQVSIRQAGDESGYSAKTLNIGLNNIRCSHLQLLN